MTEQEAIEKLKADNCVECGYSDNATRCDYGACGVAIATRMAIKALEEVQQYRAIGTPEECRAAVEKQTEIRNKAIDDFMNIVEEKADGGYFDVGGYHDVTNDIVGILDQLAEQLKGGGVNG